MYIYTYIYICALPPVEQDDKSAQGLSRRRTIGSSSNAFIVLTDRCGTRCSVAAGGSY